MYLALSLLALLTQLCFANPMIQKRGLFGKKKIEHRPWDYKFEYLKAKHTLHYLQSSQQSGLQKRKPQEETLPEIDPLFNAPPNFLPPPWSPVSNLDSPYPPSGVSPWDDSGRAQMLDNDPGAQEWRRCPRWILDCRKCPKDPRCRRGDFPWWNPVDVLDLPDIFTGPVISAPKLPGSEPEICPLRACTNADLLTSCGEKARCVRGHCICDTGFKGTSSFGPVIRGFDDLQALTVWVDPGLACDVPCDDLSCAEVEQVRACFESTPTVAEETPVGPIPWEEEEWGNDESAPTSVGAVIEKETQVPQEQEQLEQEQEQPETATVTGGAIQVPGAVTGESGDFVEGVAAPGTFGENT
ncbi:hypothetical protein BKA66DRAFT_569616 [Pyrenochaeta sp. MPI-SDFR-AT-0127]|nr:hypothetical protein BKA66DRAFT_569616 [Pyrenochaeta sp. MPI-SDFR-AT-0127]